MPKMHVRHTDSPYLKLRGWDSNPQGLPVNSRLLYQLSYPGSRGTTKSACASPITARWVALQL
jgi:hypothetical protein